MRGILFFFTMSDLSNWQGCDAPRRKIMQGKYARLEPLDIAKHGDGLYKAAIAGDAQTRFKWLPETEPVSRSAFQPWLEMAGASADPMYFAVIDLQAGEIAGRQALMRMDPANGVAEIGHIHWGQSIQKTPVTTEAFYLFGAYLFDALSYRRFEWKCNDCNAPSKRAALRYGLRAEGVHRQARVEKGENRDTAWFSLLVHEWPVAGEAIRRWLDDDNFDRSGRQKQRLRDIREAIRKMIVVSSP